MLLHSGSEFQHRPAAERDLFAGGIDDFERDGHTAGELSLTGDRYRCIADLGIIRIGNAVAVRFDQLLAFVVHLDRVCSRAAVVGLIEDAFDGRFAHLDLRFLRFRQNGQRIGIRCGNIVIRGCLYILRLRNRFFRVLFRHSNSILRRLFVRQRCGFFGHFLYRNGLPCRFPGDILRKENVRLQTEQDRQ